MKIVIAPDKFKNSLTGLDFCEIIEKEILTKNSNIEVVQLPLADGGDGTIEVVNFYLKGKVIEITVNNPFFKPVKASYLYSENSKTAFIEMAEASGVKLLDESEFDCINATTFGTGEMIADAINKGAKTIILGIGGSATNDCGIGMAAALGYQFLDENNNLVKPVGANLSKIKSINASEIEQGISNVDFKIACDVTNPLYGKNGAAFVYGAQKGASEKEIILLNKGLEDFAKVLNDVFTTDVQAVKGAGAAGGMGIASKLFLNGSLEPGIQLIKNLAIFDKKIKNADWIITGEGKLDNQTLSGKTIQGVLESAKKDAVKVAAFCGKVEMNQKELDSIGILYADDIMSVAKDFNDAVTNTKIYLKQLVNNFLDKEI
ncbi:glycerate kinase [Polaribacter reichenbachii]|uniref:Glycerate kinase n=1 Tax=Polaribacter reichenbachii TaxID=996801 RepID=A0A1B8TVA1_9FLAO|nr:glycerate kinase [Polaribacter reichenbachii]APZ45500.1 glycerate kinase [Polaribacter reichenbachii]AUC19361.1 glycerate kinase [Polaribacter reichenbachii]OBY63484.1 glycerate kinase [Polaribacter reichenbachii]